MKKTNKTKPKLQPNLELYIKEKHTQEECIGFIDGFEKAVLKMKEIEEELKQKTNLK